MADRIFTVVVPARTFTVAGRKSSVHTANDTNRTTYPSGYPGSGAVWERWNQTDIIFQEIPGTYDDYN